uniref:Uncharacterized protein n=1 Tax=Siphoviridae sp. ctuvC1 TaxID=2826507 RepID=A0A8S5M031_9CAUD|nr:MAG TPA: hypothetical protein [Siphoviridae sp. ctuvC1]
MAWLCSGLRWILLGFGAVLVDAYTVYSLWRFNSLSGRYAGRRRL